MFNLFGSFFFGRGSTVEPTSNNETSSTSPSSESTLIQTTAITPTLNTDAATQTAVDDQLLMVTSQTHTSNGDMDELQKQWVIVERAKQQQQKQQQQMQNQCVATSTTHLDDVKEEDETTSVVTQQHTEVEMSEEASLPTRDDEDDGDVLVGSFFDRNQFDESPKETENTTTTTTATNPAPTRDEWLITPLPCLTSITCSQRSLVENDPLENLLIEHPSMSVFVTVTSSAMATPTTTITTEPIESAVFKVFSENVEEEKKVETSLGKSVVVVVSQRKRKGMESAQSPSSQQHQSPSPTSTMRRKANKRNKKSSPSVSVSLSPVAAVSTETVQSGPVVNSSNNKENMQVRTLLTSEFRSKTNPASKLDSILLSKNQLKRNNKHANKFNSNNCLQRKFHKLQQPVCC